MLYLCKFVLLFGKDPLLDLRLLGKSDMNGLARCSSPRSAERGVFSLSPHNLTIGAHAHHLFYTRTLKFVRGETLESSG